MLRKLMKHEFRATARLMLPLYLAALVLALLSRLGDLATQHIAVSGFNILDLLYGIITVGFAVALIAVPVVAFILMILRFRSNLLADEGYVMFTLPVSTHQLVWSKLLVSLVWFVGAVVVDALAVMVLAADRAFNASNRRYRRGMGIGCGAVVTRTTAPGRDFLTSTWSAPWVMTTRETDFTRMFSRMKVSPAE